MTHAESQEVLLDFAYGELPPDVALEVEEHLAGCAECSQAKAQLEGVRKAFAPIRESEEPGAGFDERILAAARAEAQLEHDGNIGEVIEVAGSVAPSGLDAARIDAHAASVAPSPARKRPQWMTRAVLGGSVAAAAALALVVSTSVSTNRERKVAQASNFEIHVAPQGAPPSEAPGDTAGRLARNEVAHAQLPPSAVEPAAAAPPPAVVQPPAAPPPAAVQPPAAPPTASQSPAAPSVAASPPTAALPAALQQRSQQEPSESVQRALLATKKSRTRALEEGSGGDVPEAAELAKAAPAPQNPRELERRAEAARHTGNYPLAAGLYRQAAAGRENDSSAAAWDLAHAIECLAASGSFDEAGKVRDQLGKSYPAETTALGAARRALREVESSSPAKD
jgi:hypothetical protein